MDCNEMDIYLRIIIVVLFIKTACVRFAVSLQEHTKEFEYIKPTGTNSLKCISTTLNCLKYYSGLPSHISGML